MTFFVHIYVKPVHALGAVLATVVFLAVAVFVILPALRAPEETLDGDYVVAVTFPGIVRELERLVGEGRVALLVAPGADPHDASLTPKGRRVLAQVLVVITMGHTHVDLEIEELKRKGEIRSVVINIAEVEGVVKPVLPDGRVNYHELFCDPSNLKVILEAIASALVQAGYDEEAVRSNLTAVFREIEEIKRASGLLRGYRAVISYAGIQPQVEWLGLRIAYYIAEEAEHSPSPRRLEEARRILRDRDVIVVIRVDSEGKPLTRLDSWLSNEAAKAGRPVLKVRSCSLEYSVLEVLRDTASSARALAETGAGR